MRKELIFILLLCILLLSSCTHQQNKTLIENALQGSKNIDVVPISEVTPITFTLSKNSLNYNISNADMNWTTARDYCQSIGDGWNLTTIESNAENDFILSLAQPKGFNYAQIGANSNSAENTWKWYATEQTFYTGYYGGGGTCNTYYCNWGYHEPQNTEGTDNNNASAMCINALAGGQCDALGQWIVNSLDSTNKKAICEKDTTSSFCIILNLSISPSIVHFDSILNCSINIYNTGLSGTSNVKFNWTKNGIVQSVYDSNINSVANGLIVSTKLVDETLNINDVWNCSAYIEDSVDNSENDTIQGTILVVESDYNISSSNMNWTDARDYCQNIGDGWNLTTINSSLENTYVLALGQANNYDYDWIGGIATSANVWKWQGTNVQFYDGASCLQDYCNWGPGEPQATTGVTAMCILGLAGGRCDALGQWLEGGITSTNKRAICEKKYIPIGVTINSVDITPSTAYYNSDLNCSVSITNTVSGLNNIGFVWTKNSIYQPIYDSTVINVADGTIYSTKLVDETLVKGDVWNCSVYAEDASDASYNNTDFNSITISNFPPTFDYYLDNQTIYHNQNISLDYNCSDLIELDSVNYYIQNTTFDLATPLEINISTGIINQNVTQADSGNHTYNIICSDDIGVTNVTQEVNITINNRAPSIPITLPVNNSQYTNSANLICNLSTDPENDTIYYQFWNETDVWNNSTSVNYTLSGLGVYNWKCRACDTEDVGLSYSKCSNFTSWVTTSIYSFTNCTTGTPSLFIRYKDSDTDNFITASLKANLHFGDNAIEFLYNLPVAYNHSFCLNGTNNISVSGMLEYVNDSYDARNYYFTNAQLTNTQTNLTLYLLPQTLASAITFTVVDGSGNALSDRTIYVEKYDVATNSYTLTAMGKTDSNGQDVIFLRGGTPDTGDIWYRFKVYYNDILETTTLPQKIVTTTITIRVSGEEWAGYISGMQGISTSLTFDNSTHTFRLDYSVASGTPKTICLMVDQQKSGGAIYNLSNQCQNSASGTLYYALPNTEGTFKAMAYAYGSPIIYLQWKFWSETVAQTFGDTGLFLAIGIVAVLVGIGAMIHPIAIVGFGAVGLVGVSLMKFIIFPPEVMLVIIGLSVFLVVLLSRRDI